MSKENQIKTLQVRLDRDKLSLKRDVDRLSNYEYEVALAKSDYEAKLVHLDEEKAQLEAGIAAKKAEIEKTEAELAAL